MNDRQIDPEQKEHISQDILLGILKTGAVLAVAIVAPNALQIFKPWVDKSKHWKKYYPSSLKRQTVKLWRKGLVNVTEGKDGYTVTITDKGKSEILKYDINSINIPVQKLWDGKWRMVFFDIPSGNETIRSVFRKRLKLLGFFQMQKSVYVFPYPCDKEIHFLREVYGISHYIKLATVERLENSSDLQHFFKL